MTRPIPYQQPEIPPRYHLRIPRDRYTLPTSHVSERRAVVEPFDGGDWSRYRDEPHPFEWREMRDPMVWVGGFLMFLAIVVFVVAVSIQDVR